MQLTSGKDLLFKNSERVSAAVLLFDDDGVARIEAFEVELKGAAEVVHAHLTVGVRCVRLAHGRLLLVEARPLMNPKQQAM